MPGWGTFIGKIAEQFQGRIERLKNEKVKLERERDDIESIKLDITNADHRRKAARLSIIIGRIDDINKLLASKASD